MVVVKVECGEFGEVSDFGGKSGELSGIQEKRVVANILERFVSHL